MSSPQPYPQPVPPPPDGVPARTRRRRWPWLVGGIVVATVISGCGGEPNSSPSPSSQPAASPSAATTAPALTGAAAILQAAGPLHAHVENTNQLICDPATATVTESGSGFLVHVNYPGPANIGASVLNLDQQGSDQSYTLSSQEAGHDFTFTQFPLSNSQVITVTVSAAAGGGTCDVVNHTP